MRSAIETWMPTSAPTDWSVGPWDHEAGDFEEAAYRGGDLRAPTVLEGGRRIVQGRATGRG